MIIHRGYKTELKLNNRQRTLCSKHAGCARFAYNWGLRRMIEEYEKTGRSPNAIELHRELVKLKQTILPWMYEVSKCAPQEALRNLDNAFKHFYRRVKNGEKPGFPKFKSRKQGIRSFRLAGDIRVFNNRIQLPRIGHLKLKEQGYLPPESDHVHILSATVSEKAGRWFVSLTVEEKITIPKNTGPKVGVDVGISTLVTVSDGTVVENPRTLERYKRKLKRVQRKLSRKRHQSKNRPKTRVRLQRIYGRIANIRKDLIHKTTSKLAKTKSVIVIEDLNVLDMLKNHIMAKSIADASFSEFRRQLGYKTQWYGSKLIVAPRFFPSSKMCSNCGNIKSELPLSTRTYVCNQCGFTANRDVNASYNLQTVAVSLPETQNACFEAGGYRPLGSVPASDTGTERKTNWFS